MATINLAEVIKMYRDGSSPYQIAEHFGTYTNKIRRMLIKAKEPLRDKSEAQKQAIESGRANHPTEGRQRTEKEKMAISSSAVRHWSKMTEEERNKRKEKSKESWNKMSPETKKLMRKKANEKIRRAAKEGSKLEKEIQNMLNRAGYKYQAHKKDLIPTKKLEIDLYIPELKTIIEVDGLSHFEPIWGEEQLEKQQEFDIQKDGVLLSKGFKVIRIENRGSSMAISKLSKLEQEINEILESIKNETNDSNLKVINYE